MPSPVTHDFDLCFVLDGKRFLWRNPNCGVSLTDDGRQSAIAWHSTESANTGARLWTEIAAVSLSAGTDGRSEVNNCRIVFNDGRAITVADTGPSGTLDAERTPVYRAFVRALHARLAQAPEGRIAFTAGVTPGRHRTMQVILAVTIAFFVITPFALLLITGDWRTLGILLAGAGFVWPLWRNVEKNAPRRYDPRQPPGELME